MNDSVDTAVSGETPASSDDGIAQNSVPSADQAADAVAQDTNDSVQQKEEVEDIDGICSEDGDSEAEGENPNTPESYSTENIQVPDGMKIDEGIFNSFSEIAREVGLDQKAFDTIYNKMGPVFEARQQERLKEVKAKYIRQAKSDKDMGGANWNETKSNARKALYQFFDAPTRELLAQSGLDCHPGIIKGFRNIQRAVGNDKVVRGGRAAEGPSLNAFFKNSKMN